MNEYTTEETKVIARQTKNTGKSIIYAFNKGTRQLAKNLSADLEQVVNNSPEEATGDKLHAIFDAYDPSKTLTWLNGKYAPAIKATAGFTFKGTAWAYHVTKSVIPLIDSAQDRSYAHPTEPYRAIDELQTGKTELNALASGIRQLRLDFAYDVYCASPKAVTMALDDLSSFKASNAVGEAMRNVVTSVKNFAKNLDK